MAVVAGKERGKRRADHVRGGIARRMERADVPGGHGTVGRQPENGVIGDAFDKPAVGGIVHQGGVGVGLHGAKVLPLVRCLVKDSSHGSAGPPHPSPATAGFHTKRSKTVEAAAIAAGAIALPWPSKPRETTRCLTHWIGSGGDS